LNGYSSVDRVAGRSRGITASAELGIVDSFLKTPMSWDLKQHVCQ
jgi:hypothetical protein